MTASTPRERPGREGYSPVFLHARKEALLILIAFLLGLCWAVPYCYHTGYLDRFDPAEVRTVWGVPRWLFWGIVFPWIVANLFTAWFCFYYMADDDLGEAHEGADIEEELAERRAARKDLGE